MGKGWHRARGQRLSIWQLVMAAWQGVAQAGLAGAGSGHRQLAHLDDSLRVPSLQERGQQGGSLCVAGRQAVAGRLASGGA